MNKKTFRISIFIGMHIALLLFAGIACAQDADTLAPAVSLDALKLDIFQRPLKVIKDPIMTEIVHDLKNKAIAPAGFAAMILRKFPEFEGVKEVKAFGDIAGKIQDICLKYLQNGTDFSDELRSLETDALELRRAKEALMVWIEHEGKIGNYLKVMAAGTDEMLEKIFSILNWSGRSTEWFVVTDFLKDAAIALEVPGVKIRVVFSDDVAAMSKEMVSTYKGILQTATEELVKNALKYSGSEKIEIIVSLIEESTSLSVTVRDFGKGISSQALDRLNAGIPVGTEAKDSLIGTGYGLFTLKNALESVGGTLSASSENGKTDFNFSMPIEIPLDVIRSDTLQKQFAVVVCGLGGSGRRVMSHWLGAKLRLRYINSGFLPRMVFYKLLEEKDALNINLLDESAVTKYVEKFLLAGRVDYSSEPVRLDGVNTAAADSNGIIVREKIKMLINTQDNRELFYQMANYPRVIKALNDFFVRLKDEIKAEGRYNGIVVKSTEPFPFGFTNIMLHSPGTVRAERLRFRPEDIYDLDVKTGQHNFLSKFSAIKRFESYSSELNRDILPRDIGEDIIQYLVTLESADSISNVCRQQSLSSAMPVEKSI